MGDHSGEHNAFGSWIDQWAAERADHPAIHFEGRVITFAQLSQRIDNAVDQLRSHGVQPGDRVVFLGPNRPGFLVVFLAAARAGAIFVPLNSRLTVAEHAFQLQDSAPSLAVVDPSFADHIRDAAPSLSVVALGDDDELPPGSGPSAGRRVEADAAPTDLLIVYTSGTTGKPKGAVHTHASLSATMINSIEAQGFTANDVGLAALPLFHVGGLNIQTMPLLAVGATVVLHRAFNPSAVLADIASFGATASLFVPAMIRALLDHPDFSTTDFSTIRGVMTGSSVVPVELLEPLHNAGLAPGQVYGSTETGPTAIVLRFEESHRFGSAGRPALLSEAKLGDDNEVLVRGPHLFDRYWENPQATEQAFVDGWYRMGDVGHIEDGTFVIDERLDDVIISGGENVYPAEVEIALEDIPGIDELAIVGRPHERWGQVPIIVAVLQPGADVDLEQIRAFGAERLATFKLPKDLVVVDTLPRTALGKVQKYLLRNL